MTCELFCELGIDWLSIIITEEAWKPRFKPTCHVPPTSLMVRMVGHFILTLKHQDRQSQVAFTLQIIQSDQQMGNQYTSKVPFSPSINRGYSHFTHPSLQQTSFFWVSHCFPVFIPLKQWLTPRRFSFWVFYSLLSSSSPLRCRPES